MILKFLAYAIGSVVAILAVGTIFPPDWVSYSDDQAVLLFGVVLGMLTVFVKPILSALTLPLSCLTFGLFSLVVNASLFWASARAVPEIVVTYQGALMGGIFAAVINGVIYSVVDEK